MRTVIGLFDDRNEAMRAYTALYEAGYAKADLDILTNDDKEDIPKLANMRKFVPAPDVDVYLEGVRLGGTIITANVTDSAVMRATEIMSGFSMVNVSKRATEFQKTNTNLTLSDPAQNDNVIEVIEEDLEVGTEQVERGRMRIYSVVTEREVQKDVTLRDETIKVQRRPVNRTVEARPDLFQQRSFEMVEVDEIAKVSKTARVVEEVSLGKEVVDKIETIKETLRRQDVEIEEVPCARTFNDYENDFRSFYSVKLADRGVSYDELRPAFQYGYDLATREPFRSSPWSAVETDARRIWEDKNPGTWDQHSAVVKYAWERIRNAR
ncbi:MAG: YsnF/AvaK domain-containing protein [Oscillatoriales cyanobacterium RM2_1_1]|nr:YsnF/AvaK domain-containing protein [Oscillatoriales cyanobacterium SM2_3_0]NJO44637.1 YsnF/AvaK domain-containing protein [Oscillatoriales cyanobacterium RM2_1_1]